MSRDEIETRTRILKAAWQLLEKPSGREVRMSDIAKAAGVSRQALYLHFSSRSDLLIATMHYGDQVYNLQERMQYWLAATTGIERLTTFVEFWGNYIPQIYGTAKALLAVIETDEATAAAWNERMMAVWNGCRITIEALQRDGMLAPEWEGDDAIDLFWTMLSIHNWEQLTVVCGWSTDEYIRWMHMLVQRIFVRSSPLEEA